MGVDWKSRWNVWIVNTTNKVVPCPPRKVFPNRAKLCWSRTHHFHCATLESYETLVCLNIFENKSKHSNTSRKLHSKRSYKTVLLYDTSQRTLCNGRKVFTVLQEKRKSVFADELRIHRAELNGLT